MAKKRRKTKTKAKTTRKRKSTRRSKKKGWLGSLAPSAVKSGKPSAGEVLGKTATTVGTALAGMAGGMALGKYSFYTGLAVTGLGVYKRNPYLSVAGTAMMAAPVVKNASAPITTTVEGFDPKQVAMDAKERLVKGFKNFTEKITFKESDGMSGLYGNEPVTYYVNPYASGELPPGSMPDMSALDRVQEQIAMMNGGSSRTGFEDEESSIIY